MRGWASSPKIKETAKVKKLKFAGLSIIAISALALSATTIVAAENDTAAKEFNSIEKSGINNKELEGFIYNYLMENPGIIIEAVDKYRQNQEAEEAKMFDKKLGEHKTFLQADSNHSPSHGNPDADIVIVEFFDYNCGYCKKALKDVQAIIKQDKNVRFVFKDMPILSPSSHQAALWALAAERQGKYWEYHVALMDHGGSKDEATLERLAKNVGLDIKQLRKDLKDPALQEAIDKNILVSQELGIRGTPAFIINDKLSRGYIGLDTMKSIIEQIRADEKG